MKKTLLLAAILSLSTINSEAQKTYECKGFSMTAEGDLISEYLATHDGMKRHIYVGIISDTVVYTVFRDGKDGAPDMLKKWKVPISIINASSPYFGVFHWMNGSEKIHKVTLPIISGHKFLCEEFFCSRSTTPQLVSISDKHELSFNSEDKAKAFFEEVKAIRARLETPSGSGSSASSGDKKLSGTIYIRNRTSADVYIKVEGGSSASKVLKNGSSSISCSAYSGKKVMLVTGDHKVIQTLFTVNEDICKKGEYILGK